MWLAKAEVISEWLSGYVTVAKAEIISEWPLG